MAKLKIGAFILIFYNMFFLHAQELNVDVQFRPRFEYRHGFNQPFSSDTDPAFFISQRSRLNIGYTEANFEMYFSLQDVSIWGDRPQISNESDNNFRLQQMWSLIPLSKNWSTKIGRQEINLDDQRIFGAVNWLQQARTHDAALIKHHSNNTNIELGIAFNQNKEDIEGNTFASSGPGRNVFQYKSMQYVHINQDWDKFSGSLLFTNTGFQDQDNQGDNIKGTSQRQTTGVHLKYKKNAFGATSNLFYQFGDFQLPSGSTIDINGYLASLELTYKVKKILFGLGTEIISGDNDGLDNGTDAFFPLFGTNHKFNGYLDYFYVGNHANSVGLNDMYAKAIFTFKDQANLLGKVHYFLVNKELVNGGNYLGTEIDLIYTRKLYKFVTLKMGYSHAFLDENIENLRGITNPAETNNWGWVMLTVNPKILTWKNKVPLHQ